jgi:DNA-binding NarL/FixJ family response regulator
MLEPLTARETDFLRLMVVGLTNQAFAQVLSLSPGTVMGYTHTILQKLGTNDRTQAAVKAIRLGLVK